MNDPRHGGPRIRSPPEKIRVHRSEWNIDPYLPPGGGDARKKIPSRPLRSLSPPELERPRRILSVDRRGKSIERGDSTGHVDDGGREDRVHPRSPTYVQTLKWSQFEEGFQTREGFIRREAPPLENRHKYLLQDSKDLSGNANTNLKHIGGAGPSGSRITEEKNFHGITSSSTISGHGISLKKSVYLGDRPGPERSYFRLPPEVGPTINSGKISRNFPSAPSPGNLDINIHGDEELRYVDNIHRNKVPSRGPYKEDKELFYSRDVPDSVRVLPRSKAYGGTSMGVSDDEFFVSSQDSLHLPSYGFGRKQRNIAGPVGQEGYSQAPPSDFARDPELDSAYYHQDLPSPTRDEHQVYRYSGYARMERGNPEHLPNEVHRKVQPSVRVNIASKDSLRPSYSGSVVGRFEYIESSHKNRQSVVRARDNHPLPGEPGIDYMDKRRNSLAIERDREFLGSGSNHIEFRTKVSREGEMTYSEGDYGFGGDAGPLTYKGRMRRLQMSECDPDTCRLDPSPQRRSRAEELDMYDPTARMLKRKYCIPEEMDGHNSRSMLLSSRNTSRRVQELTGRDKQWPSEDPGDISLTKRLRFGQLEHRKVGRPYDGTIASRLSASDDWISTDDLPVHVQRRAVGGYTPDGIKGRLRPCPPSYHDSYPLDRRNYIYKSNKYWKRTLDNQYGCVPTDDGDLLEDSVGPVKPEPPEDSEEFKQLVDNSFFRFSKQLNENPSLRRKFREQGYAGTLFCSVCGRNSKEFMDTRSLVTHTFMSRKVGMRSDHLGLHKALCVLMGWNSTVAPNGACLYQVLSEADALAKKEDLVLWPPLVVIHNSSIGYNTLDEQQVVVSIEQMEAILIEMGFSGGMIKLRLGKPANQSIMVVKFLPTFSGLQEAERLHQYYIEKKHGRRELQQLNSNVSGGNGEAGGTDAEKMERVLYGYMGIAEDLDKLDFETKKRSVVKSKKDIQAIADAPLKTE